MALLITFIIYAMSWGFTFFNKDIIHYRSFTNNVLSKYDKVNFVFKWINIVGLVVALIAFIAEIIMKAHTKSFLVFLSEFVVLTLLIAPATSLIFEYLYNKVFKIINRIYFAINAIFVVAYLLYPFFIIKILDVNDQTKILISQSFVTIELYLFLFLIIYMIFMTYQISTLAHKIALVERYYHNYPKYKLTNELKQRKYRWLIPLICSKELLKDTLNNNQIFETILVKYRYLPKVHSEVNKDKKDIEKLKHKALRKNKKKRKK